MIGSRERYALLIDINPHHIEGGPTAGNRVSKGSHAAADLKDATFGWQIRRYQRNVQQDTIPVKSQQPRRELQ
jgi:hypothetical protein